ncbi:MAG: hypothetical protein AAFW76_00025 [Pseudomonadota bacterium]
MKALSHTAVRSLVGLLLLWLANVIVFAWLYLGRHRFAAETTQDGYNWLAERMAALTGGDGPPLACVAGAGDPWDAALILSLKSALPVITDGLPEKMRQIYACLFGLVGQQAPTFDNLPTDFVPVIPDSIAYLGLAQSAISAVLLLLIVRAIWTR